MRRSLKVITAATSREWAESTRLSWGRKFWRHSERSNRKLWVSKKLTRRRRSIVLLPWQKDYKSSKLIFSRVSLSWVLQRLLFCFLGSHKQRLARLKRVRQQSIRTSNKSKQNSSCWLSKLHQAVRLRLPKSTNFFLSQIRSIWGKLAVKITLVTSLTTFLTELRMSLHRPKRPLTKRRRCNSQTCSARAGAP